MRGQSELLPVAIYIGLALVLGTAMLSYFSSVLAGYRDQLELSNHLRHEASNTHFNIVSYDSRNNVLWVLLKRFDGSRSSYLIAVDTGSGYLSCANIHMYNPYGDADGVVCNSAGDCIASSTAFSGSPERVYIPWEGSISTFLSYARTFGYSTGTMHICRVENVCRYAGRAGLCDEATIVRLQLPSGARVARTLVITMYNNIPYVVAIHEVSLG